MKKPKTVPAPTPLEMAQRILEAQAAKIAVYRAYIDGIDKPGARERYSEWNRVRESYLSVLALFGPQVATAYVSLHARNLELAGTPFGKQLAEVEAERDAALAENQRLADLVRHCRAELHEDGLITNEEYATLLADSGSVARLEGYDALRERVEALEAAVCPKCAIEALLPTAPSGEGEGDA